jgi:hypothetical protein
MKIEQAERQFAQKLVGPLQDVLSELGYSIPAGYQEQINLQDANGRKKRSDASAENWAPESGRIVIWFERAPQTVQEPKTKTLSATAEEPPHANSSDSRSFVHPAEAELLRALDRTESRPGWSFVPLRKFRDEILPLENCPSIRTDVERNHILRTAIEKKLIVVGKVANPKAPQFPVTTIRVNRLTPEVKTVLGGSENSDLDFHPVAIAGEPLSTTVLRERR